MRYAEGRSDFFFEGVEIVCFEACYMVTLLFVSLCGKYSIVLEISLNCSRTNEIIERTTEGTPVALKTADGQTVRCTDCQWRVDSKCLFFELKYFIVLHCIERLF